MNRMGTCEIKSVWCLAPINLVRVIGGRFCIACLVCDDDERRICRGRGGPGPEIQQNFNTCHFALHHDTCKYAVADEI